MVFMPCRGLSKCGSKLIVIPSKSDARVETRVVVMRIKVRKDKNKEQESNESDKICSRAKAL